MAIVKSPRAQGLNYVAVVAAQAGGQFLLLGVTPLLTRLYPASAIGTYQVALALSMLITPVMTLRIDLLIPGPVSSAFTRSLQRRSLAACAISLVVGCGIFTLLRVTGQRTMSENLALALALALVTAWSLVDTAFLIRSGRLRRLATRNLLSGVAGGSLQVLGAFLFMPNAAVLGLALVAGRGFAVLVTRTPKKRISVETTQANDTYTWGQTASAVLSAFMAAASVQLPILLASMAYSDAEVGQLAVAARLAGLPLTLLGTGLTHVAVSMIGRSLRTDPATAMPVLKRLIRRSLALALVTGISVVILAIWYTPILFGPGWERAGQLSLPLALLGGAQLATVPFLGVFSLIGEQTRLARLQAGRLLMTGMALIAAIVLVDDLAIALGLYAFIGAILYASLISSLKKRLALRVSSSPLPDTVGIS